MSAGPRGTPKLLPEEPSARGEVVRPRLCEVCDEAAEDVRAAVDEVARGEGIELTPEQLKHWVETGEYPWPESPSPARGS